MKSSIPAGASSDECFWFPMRVAYGRGFAIREVLKEEGVEYFLPVDKKIIPDESGPKVVESLKISNLIFIHSSKDRITELKHNDNSCSYLRFMTYIPREDLRADMTDFEKNEAMIKKDDNGNPDIITIDDRVMQLFIYALEVMKEHVTLLKMSDNLRRMGKRCRILGGKLAGMEGVLRRVQNIRRVYIDLNGIITARIDSMPRSYIEILE